MRIVHFVFCCPQPKPDSSSKKKWKSSHVYLRHTRKIDITSLINANPDPEYVSTRGRAVSFTPTGVTEGGDDKDGKGRGRGNRRRGSTGPGIYNLQPFCVTNRVDKPKLRTTGISISNEPQLVQKFRYTANVSLPYSS